jgi:hypothetical protein
LTGSVATSAWNLPVVDSTTLTEQEASPDQIEAVRQWLEREGTCLVLGPRTSRPGATISVSRLSIWRNETSFWNVEGSSAYAVVAGTLTVTIKGQSVVRTGTLAYTFGKRDGAWKIEAQAWGRTS